GSTRASRVGDDAIVVADFRLFLFRVFGYQEVSCGEGATTSTRVRVRSPRRWAASVRQGNWRSSLRRDYFLYERLKARIAPNRVKQRFHFDVTDVRAVAIGKSLLQPVKRLFVLAQAKIEHGSAIRDAFTTLTDPVEFGQCLFSRVFVAGLRFGGGK